MIKKTKLKTALLGVSFWIFCILISLAGYSQNGRTITGKVTNTEGALIGVTVHIKDQNENVVTGKDGKFKIKANPGDILVFTHIGYADQEITIGDQSEINIVLQNKSTEMNDIVVTALGIKREERSLTYATQQISGSEITAVKDPDGNIMNSLNGKIAGAVITPAATGPGGAVRVVLRGNRSISGSDNALIVVDGVPVDNTMTTEQGGGGGGNRPATQLKSVGTGWSGSDGAATINPEDVESVTVLKGPAAAALYGSRAANGVLIITTKKGKQGKVAVSYSGGITADKPLMLMKLQNTYGRGSGGIFSPTAAGSWGDRDSTFPNNVRDFYNTGMTVDNSVSISGGTEKMQGYASYSNDVINGIVPNNSLNRNTLNLRLGNEILRGLTTDVKLTYVNQEINNKPRLGTNGVTNELLIMPRDMSSDELKEYETINPNTQQPVPHYWTNSSGFQNPYWDVNRTALDEGRDRIMLVGSVKYQIMDWLSVQGRYSLDQYNDRITGTFYAGTLPVTTNPGGRYQVDYVNHWEKNMDILLSGKNPIGSNFGVNYNLGASILNNNGYDDESLANGLTVPNMFDLNFATTPSFSYIESKKEIQSVYGNGELDYKQQLFLDVSGRNDWSSTLPPPYGFFYPSIGLSGILSEMVKLPSWVNFAKVRGAYTQVGNDADPYLLRQTYTYSPGAGQGFIARDGNRDIDNLKPERTESWEFGTDWRFLNGRLGVNATVYKTNTINQLILISLPQPSGFNTQYINGGNVQNKGIELVLTGTPIKRGNFSWNSTINFALNRNKVITLPPGITQASLTTATNFAQLLIKPGGSFGDLYGTVWSKNANGDHLISSTGLPAVTKLQKIGNPNPDYTLGWMNQFQYKHLYLSILIDGRVGGTLISGTDAMLGYFGVASYTTAFRDGALILPGVMADGSKNTTAIGAQQLWTQVSQGGTDGYGQFFAYDATDFRLRELSVGYNFPLKSNIIKSARVSFTARNLFFLYRGKSLLNIPGIGKRTLPVDPEAAIGTSSYQGIESGILPSTRSYGFNLIFSF